MHYQKATVLWTYHRRKQTKYNPTLKEIEEWDERLWKRFDQHLVPKMTAAGITPIDKATKSRVVALAAVSKGGGNAKKMVHNGCRFYKNTWGLF